MGLAALDGFFQGSAIHPRHHEDAACALLLDNGRDEAIGVELQFVKETHGRWEIDYNNYGREP